MMVISKFISSPAEKTSTFFQTNFPGTTRNIKTNCSFLFEKFSDNYAKFTDNYPYISNTRTTITSTIHNGTEYVYSIPNSVYSYTSMFQPVDVNEREVTRTPPNQNLKDDSVTPLSDERISLVDNILDLYSCKLSMDYFRHYDPDVEFSDPLMYTRGLKNIKAQFYGMPKIFVKSTTESYKIIENSKSVLKIDLNQKYTLPFVNRAVTQNSLIVLEFNDQNKICKHADYWNGKEEDFGKENLRTNVARLVSTIVRVPEV